VVLTKSEKMTVQYGAVGSMGHLPATIRAISSSAASACRIAV